MSIITSMTYEPALTNQTLLAYLFLATTLNQLNHPTHPTAVTNSPGRDGATHLREEVELSEFHLGRLTSRIELLGRLRRMEVWSCTV